MIVQLVKYKTGLSDEEAVRTIAERAPQYEALPGLRQKLYIKEQGTDGVRRYLHLGGRRFDARVPRVGSRRDYPEAYRVEGEPWVEIFEVVSILRAEQGIAPTS